MHSQPTGDNLTHRAPLSACLWPVAMETDPIIHTGLYQAVRLSIETLVYRRTQIQRLGRESTAALIHTHKNVHNAIIQKKKTRKKKQVHVCVLAMNEQRTTHEQSPLSSQIKQNNTNIFCGKLNGKFWNWSTDIYCLIGCGSQTKKKTKKKKQKVSPGQLFQVNWYL